MERIRIVLAELPRMLRDIVRETIDRQDDMHVIGDIDAGGEALSWSGSDDADIVVAGVTNESLDDRFTGLMRHHPDLKVLGITGDARRAFLFQLRPHCIPLGDASPDALLGAIRAILRRGAG